MRTIPLAALEPAGSFRERLAAFTWFFAGVTALALWVVLPLWFLQPSSEENWVLPVIFMACSMCVGAALALGPALGHESKVGWGKILGQMYVGWSPVGLLVRVTRLH